MADDKYVSEKAGKRYPVLVGIIGVLFFFAQMLLPMAAMFAFMPGFFLVSWDMPQLDSGAVHRGTFYYPVNSLGFDQDERAPRTALYRFDVGSPSPRKVDDYRADDGKLVSTGGDLWIVSRSRLLRLGDGRVEPVLKDASLGTISRPFAYRGRPAVVESLPDGYWLKIYREGAWEKGPALDLDSRDQRDLDCSALDALAIDGVLHFFLEFEDGLYHRQIDPDRGEAGGSWKPVTGEEHRWNLTVLDGEPVVFYTPSENPFGGRLIARRHSEAGWETLFELPGASGEDFLARPGSRSDQFDLLGHGAVRGLTLLRIDRGAIQERAELGEGFLGGMSGVVGGWMMYMIAIVYGSYFILPVVLVIIVSVMMFRYRVVVFSHAGQSVPYASLLRRAIARGIDLVLLGLPLLAAQLSFMVSFFEQPDPRAVLWLFGLVALGMVWALVVVVVFSFLEGRWGKTPGKWVTGISVVGSDLAFCGFGRAIIRNLLMFVDGFFNFLVGVLMIALTEHWQRLGDYAADTIVVRDETDEAEATNEARRGAAAGSKDPDPPEIG